MFYDTGITINHGKNEHTLYSQNLRYVRTTLKTDCGFLTAGVI